MAQQVPLSVRITIAVAVVSLLCSFCCGGVGIMGYRQGTRTQAQPQELTLQRLAENGFGENAHVLLSDVELLTDEYVVEEESISGVWKKVWVPLIPADADDRDTFRVVLEADDVSSEESLESLAEQE